MRPGSNPVAAPDNAKGNDQDRADGDERARRKGQPLWRSTLLGRHRRRGEGRSSSAPAVQLRTEGVSEPCLSCTCR